MTTLPLLYTDLIALAIALFLSGFTIGMLVARRAVREWLARQRQQIKDLLIRGGSKSLSPLLSLLKGANMATQKITTYLSVDCRLCGTFQHIECEQWQADELDKPRSERMFIQDIFPDLPIGDRELLISGTCNTCWQNMFGNDEDEGDDTDIYTEKEEQA